MINIRDFNKVCNECNKLLTKKNITIERISISWLNIVRYHPIIANNYEILFGKYYGFNKISLLFKILLIWLLDFKKIILSGREKYFFYKNEIDHEIDVLFFSHVLSISQFNSKNDFYFHNLPTDLEKKNLRVSVVSLLHFDFNLFSLNNKKIIGNNIYFTNFLDLKNEFLIIKKCFSESIKLFKSSLGEKDDFKKKILEISAIQALSKSTRNNIRISIQFNELLKIIKPKNLVILFEGHAYEKILIATAKKTYNDINCIAYQHTGLVEMSNSFKNIFPVLYTPNYILTSGLNAKLYFKEIFKNNKINIDILGSNRGSMSLKETEKIFNWNDRKSCLVIPEGFESECILLFNFSLKCSYQNPGINFIWRLHPNISFDKLKKTNSIFKNIPSNIFFSNDTLENDIKKCAWVLYRGSTAVIKSMSFGLRPLYLKTKDNINIDPLSHISNFKSELSEIYDFIQIINLDIKQNFKNQKENLEFSQNVCKNIFSDYNIKILEKSCK